LSKFIIPILLALNSIGVQSKNNEEEKEQKGKKNSAEYVSQRSRIAQSVEAALKMGEGSVIVSEVLDASLEFPANPKKLKDHLFSERFACPVDRPASPVGRSGPN